MMMLKMMMPVRQLFTNYTKLTTAIQKLFTFRSKCRNYMFFHQKIIFDQSMPKMPGGDDGEKKEETAESREEAKEQVFIIIIINMGIIGIVIIVVIIIIVDILYIMKKK